MKLSASQAAKQTGKSVPTITRAIKSGILSAEKIDGGFRIDPSELFRVFPAVTANTNATPQPLGNETPLDVKALEVEIKLLREMLEETKTDRDAWKVQAEQALRLLPAPSPEPTRKSKGWAWRWPFAANG